MFLPSPVVAAGADHSTRRPAYEVADVVRAYGAAFLRTHPTAHAPRRVLRAIARCRTALLGGHVEGWRAGARRQCPDLLAHRAQDAAPPVSVPVAALSALFRGKYLAGLRRARTRGQLRFAGNSAALADPAHWQHLLATLASRDWVVYCKRPFAGPAQVLTYLSRYTHRVAISNRRLLSVGNGVVRFVYRDYADHDRVKEMPLGATEFLRRFLLHVVPRGFMRIRHYGLSANRHRQEKLPRCRELLGVAPAAPLSTDSPPTPAPAEPPRSSDSSATLCPNCGAPLRIIEILPGSGRDPLAPAFPDTS